MGVIPRSVHAIFDYLDGISADYTVRTSFLELYNEASRVGDGGHCRGGVGVGGVGVGGVGVGGVDGVDGVDGGGGCGAGGVCWR